MDKGNCSSLTKVFLLGITVNMNVLLFTMFLVVYLTILLTNVGMIILIRMDPQVHTPMYFFLSHLSFSDLSYSTAIGTEMLVDSLSKSKSIHFLGCALQFFIFCIFIDAECVLLAVMAFNRYKAISNPLLFVVDMFNKVCYQLLAGIYTVALADTLTHTTPTFHLYFCGSKEINHFFCDIPPVLVLSCSDTRINMLLMFTVLGFIELSTIPGVLISYGYIISSVLKIRCVEGRFKAFSTCTSHLTDVEDIFQKVKTKMWLK
uniref:Olfactory receptor family 5 subfamily W member 15 n=1 Tax=Nannospalax galili TaxID=1026970 RepID=A0A8C6QR08_NANGA